MNVVLMCAANSPASSTARSYQLSSLPCVDPTYQVSNACVPYMTMLVGGTQQGRATDSYLQRVKQLSRGPGNCLKRTATAQHASVVLSVPVKPATQSIQPTDQSNDPSALAVGVELVHQPIICAADY